MAKYKEEWWHTDAAGRRIGWVSPAEFAAWLGAVFPQGKTPRQQFADAMGIDVSKVSRWMTGKDPIPKWVGHMCSISANRETFHDFRDPEAPWLPETDSVCGKRPANAGDGTDAADTAPRRGRPRKQAA